MSNILRTALKGGGKISIFIDFLPNGDFQLRVTENWARLTTPEMKTVVTAKQMDAASDPDTMIRSELERMVEKAHINYEAHIRDIKLPEKEHITVFRNGERLTYCTLRHKVMHVIGMDDRKPYTRHGRKFFRPYRNTWAGRDNELDKLVDLGLMCASNDQDDERYYYWFNRRGLDWLGDQLGVKIYDVV